MSSHTHTNNHHAFISYRRSDVTLIEQLVEVLGSSYPTWRDTSQIRGGQVWREEIVRAIDSAYALILVVSPRTEESKEVYAEYFYALGRNIPVIPLLIDETDLPFGLENINALLWYRDPEQAVAELRKDLDHYRDRTPAMEPADDVQTYLRALQLNYLMAVENYTPMAGVARVRPDREVGRPRAVVMRPEFMLRRSSPLHREQEVVEEVRSYEDLLPALHQLRRVLILGEPGIGKTTTLFKFADELRQQALKEDTAPIPVIVPLREWSGDLRWEELVTRHLGGLAPRYGELGSRQRLYLLLDGLNEIPRDQNRREKLHALRQMLGTTTQAVVTCRELDYRDETLRLEGLATVSIHPLAPERVLDFLRRYLVDLHGEEKGGTEAGRLFWQIAGGAELTAIWEKWRGAGADLNLFFTAADIPWESPDVNSATTWDDDEAWRRVVKSQANLMHLAANPYLLWMFLSIYLKMGTIPPNRGALFGEFVFNLFNREGLTDGETFTAEGDVVSDALEELAWRLQTEAGTSFEDGGKVALTIPRREAIGILGSEERLYRAASANLLEYADPVRFTHQLLQEYFAARRMLAEIASGRLDARDLWPPERWWLPSGWEEAAVLAAGMGGDEAGKIISWLLPVNPDVAALVINRSGVTIDDRLKLMLRTFWLPKLTDMGQYPAAASRMAIGRALVSVTLQSGGTLDNRHGVMLTGDGIPDIDCVPIPGGTVTLENEKGAFPVAPFLIARYPVTNCQFQAFVEAPDGYRNPKWWENIERSDSPAPPRWTEPNCPRDNVSWYEAVAFCRWLTWKYRERGVMEKWQEIRLPTEWEWQQAATGSTPENKYPWGKDWDSSRCNNEESNLMRTTIVGLYPNGASLHGVMDMAGNVWELCLNKFNKPLFADAVNIDKSGEMRVIRGGSWDIEPSYVRLAYRSRIKPDIRNKAVGFRLAQDM